MVRFFARCARFVSWVRYYGVRDLARSLWSGPLRVSDVVGMFQHHMG